MKIVGNISDNVNRHLNTLYSTDLLINGLFRNVKRPPRQIDSGGSLSFNVLSSLARGSRSNCPPLRILSHKEIGEPTFFFLNLYLFIECSVRLCERQHFFQEYPEDFHTWNLPSTTTSHLLATEQLH